MVASAVNVVLHSLQAPVYYSTSAAVHIPLHVDVRTELKTAVPYCSIRRRSRIVTAPLDVQIVAALEYWLSQSTYIYEIFYR